MKIINKQITKQIIGENVLYAFVFASVYLIPILNSFMMAEEHVDFYNKVFLAWSIITPYLGLFLFNNYLLIPLLLNRVKLRHIIISTRVKSIIGTVPKKHDPFTWWTMMQHVFNFAFTRSLINDF